MTGPKVKTKAVSKGAGRRNQKPFKTRPFHSRDDLTSCWADLAEQPVMLLLKLTGLKPLEEEEEGGAEVWS